MKFAFTFPGQGSQSVDMMNGFADVAEVRATFDEASEILGQDMWRLVCSGPAEALNNTLNTQVAMLTADVAIYRAWCAISELRPSVVAGHSLGEYSALVAAEAVAFTDALQLVRFRAQAMQDSVAVGAGAMAAVLGLEDADVIALCAEAAQGDVLEAVNFNSPGQVVIAGTAAAVERGILLAKTKGAKRAILLPVSVPSHCTLMRPAAERLAYYLEKVPMWRPAFPLIQNADVAAFEDPAAIKTALAKQLFHPVRWSESVRKIAEDGVELIAECGPGKVLSGLNKRIAPAAQHCALSDKAAIDSLINVLNQ